MSIAIYTILSKLTDAIQSNMHYEPIEGLCERDNNTGRCTDIPILHCRKCDGYVFHLGVNWALRVTAKDGTKHAVQVAKCKSCGTEILLIDYFKQVKPGMIQAPQSNSINLRAADICNSRAEGFSIGPCTEIGDTTYKANLQTLYDAMGNREFWLFGHLSDGTRQSIQAMSCMTSDIMAII